MKYAQLCSLREEAFKRYTGVSRSSFALMVEVMQARERAKKKSGRPSALCLEDQILMTLNYWREYRTQFHLGVEYGISDGTVSKIIRQVEDSLMASGRFALPKRIPAHERSVEALDQVRREWDVVVIDATETPIERPQKNSDAATAARRRVTP